MFRSDIITTVGWSNPTTLHPVRTCPAYAEETELRVTEVTHDRLRLTRTRAFNDGSSCNAQPSNCRQEITYTLALACSICELPCTGAAHPSDGGIAIECVCGSP